MDKRWILSAKQLQKLLLVRTVRLNVIKPCNSEEIEDETSQSTEPGGNEATIEGSKHNKSRKEE